MSNDLKDLLKKMDKRLERQEDMMQQLINMVGQNNKKQEEMDSKIDRIELAIHHIEQNEPADIMAVLNQIDKKLDERDNEIQALNKRLFKTESEIERLTRQ